MIKTKIIYEKITQLELSILETIEIKLHCLSENVDQYEMGTDDHFIAAIRFEETKETYYSILEDFIKHGKAIKQAS